MESPTAVLASSYDGQGHNVPPQSSTESAGLPLDVGQVGALGVAGSGSESGTSGSSQHPNIFVRGLPLAWSEAEITAVFQQVSIPRYSPHCPDQSTTVTHCFPSSFSQYGVLSSIRLVRHSVTKQSLG